MRVRNPKAIYISDQIIKYILTAVSNGMMTLSFASINNLRSELFKFSKIWLKTGKIIYTSGNKISGIQSKRLAIKAFYQLKHQIHEFKEYNLKHGDGKALRGYEITVNPSKLDYGNVSIVNSKIIRKIKKTISNGLIYKAVEHSYYHGSINLHLHYLIVSTDRINQRHLYRSIKTIAKKSTNGNVNKASNGSKPYRRVTNWTKAIDYVTKQQGKFPLMMIHNQWQRFSRLPVMDQIKLLAKDYNESKGVECHRLYFIGSVATKWHKINADHRYCKKNGVLVAIRPNDRYKAKNKRITSRHHYSSKENISRFYNHGVYGWTKQPIKVKPISLFSFKKHKHAKTTIVSHTVTV